MNNSTDASRLRMAKESGRGVRATSPPRILSSQAIESGAVSTAASMPFAAIAAAISCRFSAAGMPAKRSSCATTGASGGAGWSRQIASTRFSVNATSEPPALAAAA